MYAFRCKTCGHLEPAAAAGENSLPHACSVCNGGVRFTPTGTKHRDLDNWEVLASATPERLAELGLAPEHVVAHAPGRDALNAADAERCRAEHDRLAAKEAAWVEHATKYHDAWLKLDGKLKTLESAEWSVERDEELAKVRHAMRELENLEFTPRDAAHKAEILHGLAQHKARATGSRLGTTVAPKHVSVFAREATRAADKASG